MVSQIIGMKGMATFEDRLKRFPSAARAAAQVAINHAVRRGRTMASRGIRQQVNLTASYLNSPGRLYVSQFATTDKLEARIAARRRPTQLAQFDARQRWGRGKTVPRVRQGVTVRVKAGGRRATIRQAFFVTLRRGTAEGGNMGVAVRDTTGLNLKKLGLRSGKLNSGFHVLYAPSVDQVFRDVREEIAPALAEIQGHEFDRQFARLMKLD